MNPTRILWRAQADLLAADVNTLNPTTPLKVHLAIQPFTPGLDLSLASLQEATFPGSAAKSCGTGPHPVYYDALTGNLTLLLKEAAGGWQWSATGPPTATETVYGVYLTDSADGILYAAEILEQPATIAEQGQGFDLGILTFQFLPGVPF